MRKDLSVKRREDIDAELREKLNADANTAVIWFTLAVVAAGCIAMIVVELLVKSFEVDWINHVVKNCGVAIIASVIPLLLRRLKIRETVITHTIAIVYLAAISFLLSSYDNIAGTCVWAIILILIVVGMSYYSNGVVLIYSFIGGVICIAVIAVRHPSIWVLVDMADHMARLGIFVIVSGMAFWVNKILTRQVRDNYRQMKLIQEYTKELELKNQELQRVDKMKDEFLANTTHELKTPLHGIIGLLEPLVESDPGPLTDERLYDISLAVSSAKRLSGLVGDILDFSKLRNRDIILHKQNIDVHVLTDMVCKSFEYQLGSKNLRIVNAIDPDAPWVYADENRFLQVMFNLIGNAVKFTEAGEIKVTAELTAGEIHIAVSDTGIGIPPERQQLIFNAFEQADDKTAREYGGTGLGLTISKSLVELHGGKLWVESTPGEGSRFTFSIPLTAAGAAVQPAHAASPEISRPGGSDTGLGGKPVSDQQFPGGGEPSILVVDDEPVNIRIVSNILHKEGYGITAAYSGQEALERVRKERKFDLVLLDVMMPQISGFEVCARIREMYTLTQLPILLVTVKNMTEDLVLGFNVGANDYLQKPFNATELKARVKTLLELKKTAQLALSAELYFLQSQIKPHFLHNTLNAVNSFIRTDPDLARDMIVELSAYLQEYFSFCTAEKTLPISKEISTIKSYLFIETARYPGKLKVEYDIDERINCDVPHLILQPIVENAVRHGVLKKTTGGTIRITVRRDDGDVLLIVEDDGAGIAPELIPLLLCKKIEDAGIGLYNVHKRMLTIYGHGIDMESRPGSGTRVQLRIPPQ